MRVLGAEVDSALLRRWAGWLSPEVQPFFVESLRRWPAGVAGTMTPELRDTYKQWRIDRSLEVLWLEEATFASMDRADRASLVLEQARCRRGAVPAVREWQAVVDASVLRAQAGGHRFVWWPSILAGREEEVAARWVGAIDAPPSRHADVPDSTWAACAGLLPGARSLAGTFPPGSGPNCFGTVLAAAGVEGAASEWLLDGPFEEWLAASCARAGRGPAGDGEAGTVLVWRGGEGRPVHAAVTIGGGWALEKPSQEWSSPRTVLGVRQLIEANRTPGWRLERHRLRG